MDPEEQADQLIRRHMLERWMLKVGRNLIEDEVALLPSCFKMIANEIKCVDLSEDNFNRAVNVSRAVGGHVAKAEARHSMTLDIMALVGFESDDLEHLMSDVMLEFLVLKHSQSIIHTFHRIPSLN